MASTGPFDALIVGGGPAGAACALWLKLLGHSPVLVDKGERLGGLQNGNPFPGDWILGQPGITGLQMAACIHDHLQRVGIEARMRCAVTAVTKLPLGGWEARLAGEHGETVGARFLVLATGVAPVTGGFGESATVLIGPGRRVADLDFRDKRVAILGGGDNAFENFLFARDRGAAARIFARHVRARRDLRNQVPPDAVSGPAYRADAKTLTVDGEPFDVFIVLYGWMPANALARQAGLVLDERGFVVVDGSRRASDPDAYAIGELAQKLHPCASTSIADGIVCAKDIQSRLEAGPVPGPAAKG